MSARTRLTQFDLEWLKHLDRRQFSYTKRDDHSQFVHHIQLSELDSEIRNSVIANLESSIKSLVDFCHKQIRIKLSEADDDFNEVAKK
jgi:hypothetical protein